MGPAGRCARGGDRQSQAQQDADAHTAGKNIGAHKDRRDAHALLHRRQLGVVRRELSHQRQHRPADEPGGEQIHAHQPRDGAAALQNGGGPAAGSPKKKKNVKK